MYNPYLYPHEKLFYQDRLANYRDCTIMRFCGALQAELEYIKWGDQDSEDNLYFKLQSLQDIGAYYTLYSESE